MAIESIRGCGYRKVGGTYLIGMGMAIPCDRLPLPLEICPVCGQGFKVTTGFSKINPDKLFGGEHNPCSDKFFEECPVCNPSFVEPPSSLLMWVGSRFYTPQSFIEESENVGVSKRIPFIPKSLEIGTTWVYVAHKEGYEKVINQYRTDKKPGIFYAFKPTRIEKLIWKSQATEKNLKSLKDRGITPVIIPDGDPDHDPKRSIWTDLKQHKKEIKQ